MCIRDRRYIILRQQQIRDAVDVIHIAADDAHARDVVQVFLRAEDVYKRQP